MTRPSPGLVSGFERTDATRRFRMVRATAPLAAMLMLATGCAAAPDRPSWRDVEAGLTRLAPSARAAAIERFISARNGTPAIEGDTRLVFLVEDDTGTPPRIVGDFNGWGATPDPLDTSVGAMRALDGTSWWVLEASADRDARIEYMIRGHDVRFDPRNPHQIPAAVGPRSEVRMPGWTPQPELDESAAVPEGQVVEEASWPRAPGRHGRVWTYRPPGCASSGNTRYPSMYVLDGGNYVEPMVVPRVLDRLIARGAIPPLIAVFVEPDDRFREYVQSDDWLTFMAADLLPGIDASYRTRPSPADRVVFGSSLGAVGAVRLVLGRPGIFGGVAAVAPPAAAVDLITDAPGPWSVQGRRWFVLGGRYDDLLADGRRLSAALSGAGATLTYLEVPEGHSRETFRGHLDDAVRALLGDPAGPSRDR